MLETNAPFGEQLCVEWVWKSSAPDNISLTLQLGVAHGSASNNGMERYVVLYVYRSVRAVQV